MPRILHEGLLSERSAQAYGRPEPHAHMVTTKLLPKPPNCDLQNDSSLQYILQAGPNEIIKFPNHPFILTYKIKTHNKSYGADARETINKENEQLLLKPNEQVPFTYWDSRLGPASLFSKLEVTIDQTPITMDSLEEYSFLFDATMNTFCTQEARMKKYSNPMMRPSTEKKSITTSKLTISPDLKRNFDDNSHDDLITAGAITRRFGFSKFPIDSGLLPCSAIFGQEDRQNSFLHSNCEIIFNLIKRPMLLSVMENAETSDTIYFGSNNATSLGIDKWDIEIVNLELMYHSITLEDPQILRKMNAKLQAYYTDVGRIIFRRQPTSASFHNETVALPENTKLVILTWMFDDQVVLNPTANKYLSPRMTFPKGCTKIEVSISGKHGMIVETGLVDPTDTAKRGESQSCVAYHSDLVHKKLYDRPFDYMFCRANDSTHDGAVLLDLSPYDIPASTNLSVRTYFTNGAQTSPAKTSLCIQTVQQYRIQYQHGKRWTWDLVR